MATTATLLFNIVTQWLSLAATKTIYGIASLATLCALLLVCFYLWRLARCGFPVNCWFCGGSTRVPFGNRNCFDCPHCDQYNGFDSEGNYNKDIPAMRHSAMNLRQTPLACRSSSTGRLPSPSNGVQQQQQQLCDACNRNQALKVAQLAQFEPTSPSAEDAELAALRARLERAYALCQRCRAKRRAALQAQDIRLLPAYWNGRGREFEPGTKPLKPPAPRLVCLPAVFCLLLACLIRRPLCFGFRFLINGCGGDLWQGPVFFAAVEPLRTQLTVLNGNYNNNKATVSNFGDASSNSDNSSVADDVDTNVDSASVLAWNQQQQQQKTAPSFINQRAYLLQQQAQVKRPASLPPDWASGGAAAYRPVRSFSYLQPNNRPVGFANPTQSLLSPMPPSPAQRRPASRSPPAPPSTPLMLTPTAAPSAACIGRRSPSTAIGLPSPMDVDEDTGGLRQAECDLGGGGDSAYASQRASIADMPLTFGASASRQPTASEAKGRSSGSRSRLSQVLIGCCVGVNFSPAAALPADTSWRRCSRCCCSRKHLGRLSGKYLAADCWLMLLDLSDF
uniref:Ima1_N domain-containing protein n=1 Tax=Macrostomum lignano TaxID=282301 RepID=A0A1I8H750_9PLAT